MYTLRFIMGNIIPKSVKCIYEDGLHPKHPKALNTGVRVEGLGV